MADDNKSAFGLGRLRKGISKRAEELVGMENEPDAKSFDSQGTIANRPFTVESEDFDRTEAPKDDMRKYWRQYETTPMIRKPIGSFASQVIEPGYYVEAEHLSDEEIQELEQWLETCAILEGELGKDWRNLAKKAIVQREVRGTVLVEKVPAKEDSDKLAGFKFLNPETIEVVTRPNQSILLAPEDDNVYEDAPTTDDGEAAAYLQDISETGQTRWGQPIEDRYNGENKIAFTRDEIIKFTRDADVGEVFGTSRLEAVSDRIEGLKQKLSDNDEAIASKAYPLWLFMFGEPDAPWERDDIRSFMKAHEMENFHPGMKQGVRGDVSVKTISGEVAEIAEYLQFDIDYIISAMPMPKYALGGFAESVGQIAGVAQQQDVQRQITEARRELESEFNPVVREKAEELGFENPERVSLKIGKRGEPEEQPNTNQNIIRYLGKDDSSGEPQNSESPQNGSDSSESDSEESEGDTVDNPIDSPDALARAVWDESMDVAELNYEDERQEEIADAIYDALTSARDTAFESVDAAYMDSRGHAARTFERDANRAVKRAMDSAKVARKSKAPLNDELAEVRAEYGVSQNSRFTNEQNLSHYVSNVRMSTRDTLDEMMRKMRVQLRRAVETNDDFTQARSRLADKYSDASLRARAELIAHMELQRAREATKLQEFERNPEIIGVRVVNDGAGSQVCSSLNGAEAYFEDGDLSAQLSENTREEFLHQGFKPLPMAPPFHFRCTSSLEPIYRA
ncbi:portal protein [Halogranum tailed virus 1]|uniref:Uncharacterized protein n=1 Tax=Halogranum tailed virus 1 TaxID=1273749 RepID=R4TKY6_9CAUD|nr:portal protein [Halogranum tailed virus 1]AGM11337.1 hypothetical protein HGTV1_7 [Halogranum tailed virus 1]